MGERWAEWRTGESEKRPPGGFRIIRASRDLRRLHTLIADRVYGPFSELCTVGSRVCQLAASGVYELGALKFCTHGSRNGAAPSLWRLAEPGLWARRIFSVDFQIDRSLASWVCGGPRT